MYQSYCVTENHIVAPVPGEKFGPESRGEYEIRAEIHNGEISLQGAYRDKGGGSWHQVVSFRTFGLVTEEMAKLTEFVGMLPSSVRMPMNAMIVRVCTVYSFMYTQNPPSK